MEKKRGDTLRARAAKKLYAERVMKDLNQSDLAERVGTKKSNISRIESGKQNITVDYLEILADALDKDVVLELRDREVRYGSKNVYCLKIFDDELMRFSMERKDGDVSVSVISVNEDLKHLFPLDLDATEAGVLRWLRRRVIPGNRELVERILSALDVEPGDIKGIIDVCLGLSLNDCYWVVPEDLTGLFSEYNLYENEFNEALSLIAYAGYGRVSDRFVTTPELTTGGMLRKAWRNRGDDGIWLYKSGTSGFANAGNEPYSEYYACQVAEQMGLDAVHYELENWHHILASKCRLFTDIETSFVPIGSIVTEGGIDRVIDCYRELGDGFYQALASMLVFDAIVVNEDRHFGNFGLLRNNRTGEIVAPAPVFDNGNSLLCRAMKSDFDGDIDGYIATRTNPYGRNNDYLKLCKKVVGPLQKKQVRKLIGFRFTESDLVNLPSWRLGALEKMIQNRIRMILEI